MYYSLNLLKKYISISDDIKSIWDNLTLKTCEIEEIISRKIPKDVVIWKVTQLGKHSDADKLFVCQIDCGDAGQYQIVTWWENIKEWFYVPVALPWCYLPEIDLKIEPRQMRWLDSNWMICSKNEIWIKEDLEYHWIWLLNEDFVDLSDEDLWKPLAEKYPWLENDILDVDNKTLTNRPDLTGHFGIAVELNSIYSTFGPNYLKYNKASDYIKNFEDTNILELLQNSNKSQKKVVAQSDWVLTYILLEISDVEVKNASFYSRTLLSDLKMNPRNNWVDFSNLFVYLTGQPVHFFDADKLEWNIIVRDAKDGEEFVDLFDNKHILNSGDIVICDEKKILALAGVIGWWSSGVDESTKNIAIEIANFDAVRIRKTGTRLWLRTDAELRYEKTISPIYSLYALIFMLDEIKYFAKDLGKYTIWWLDYYIKEKAGILEMRNKKIKIDLSEVQKFIFGEEKDWFEDIARAILKGLGFKHKWDEFVVPVWRWTDDINIKQDLFEEIVRIYGYDNVWYKDIVNNVNYVKFTDDVKINREIEKICVDQLGFDQIETHPWIHDDLLQLFDVDVKKLFSLKNPAVPEISHFRDSLFYSMLNGFEKNFRFFDNIKFFEIGKVWQKTVEHFDWKDQRKDFEKLNMILWIYSKSTTSWKQDKILELKWHLAVLFKKLEIEWNLEYRLTTETKFHPKKQWEIYLNGDKIGVVASLHPMYYEYFKFPEKAEIVFAELDVYKLQNLYFSKKDNFGQSNYETLTDQIVFRDLSFVIDKKDNFGQVITAIQNITQIKDIQVFDIYQWENLSQDKKSISVKIKIAWDGKMKTEDINKIMDRAISEVEKVWGKLRWE